MRWNPLPAWMAAGALSITGCATTSGVPDTRTNEALDRYVRETSDTSVLGPDASFIGSPLPDVGLSGLFPAHGPDGCSVAVLDGGEDSFAVRMDALRRAKTSIRIQALVFKGDETGLRVAEVLKERRPPASTCASSSTRSPTRGCRPSGCTST